MFVGHVTGPDQYNSILRSLCAFLSTGMGVFTITIARKSSCEVESRFHDVGSRREAHEAR